MRFCSKRKRHWEDVGWAGKGFGSPPQSSHLPIHPPPPPTAPNADVGQPRRHAGSKTRKHIARRPATHTPADPCGTVTVTVMLPFAPPPLVEVAVVVIRASLPPVLAFGPRSSLLMSADSCGSGAEGLEASPASLHCAWPSTPDSPPQRPNENHKQCVSVSGASDRGSSQARQALSRHHPPGSIHTHTQHTNTRGVEGLRTPCVAPSLPPFLLPSALAHPPTPPPRTHTHAHSPAPLA